MSEHRTAEEIFNKIKSQNQSVVTEKSNLKVVHMSMMKPFKNQRDRYLAYAEVDPQTYKKMLDVGKINVGWDVCRVYDAVSVVRCYKCNGYNHKAKMCTRDVKCPKCAGSHSIKDCKAKETEVICSNCKEAVTKLNLRINIDHAAWDTECPVFKKNLEIEKNKIDFLE